MTDPAVVNVGLWSSGLLMGLVGGVHCVTMCGPACSAIAGRCGGSRSGDALWALLLGRAVAYSAAGAAVAGSVGLLAQWGNELAWLRPWWLMLHVAAMVVGLWMLWQGRAPAWLAAPLTAARDRNGPQSAAAPITLPRGLLLRGADSLGRPSAPAAAVAASAGAARWRSGLIGLGWVALPCGLLHAALLTASLGSGPADGALVMASFALGSGLSLWAGPRLWLGLARWLPRAGATDWSLRGPVLATRLAGGLLAIGALWAIWHAALVPLVDAWCRAA